MSASIALAASGVRNTSVERYYSRQKESQNVQEMHPLIGGKQEEADKGRPVYGRNFTRILLQDGSRKMLESQARRNNWYKYAGAAVLGMIGIAALVAGFVFGYSWVLIGVGAVIFLASLYSVKSIEDDVKYAGREYQRSQARVTIATSRAGLSNPGNYSLLSGRYDGKLGNLY